MIWLIVMVILMIPLMSILLDSAVGRALAARLEGRALSGGDNVSHERITYLEGEVERLQSEVDRIAEESQFLHRLLTERAADESEPPALTDGDEQP